MKLYFAPGACSLSPHIVLRELGLPFDLVKVDMSSKKTSDGDDFASINPKGYVPALKTDDGKVLTEGVAINQFLADKKPESGLAPANGTFERYKLQEMLNFISTDSQDLQSAIQLGTPGSGTHDLHGQAEETLWRTRCDSDETGFPHRFEIHDRRCVFIHGAALGAEVQDRYQAMAGARALLRSCRCAACCKSSRRSRGGRQKLSDATRLSTYALSERCPIPVP